MKKYLLAAALGVSYLAAYAQSTPKTTPMHDVPSPQRLQAIEDKLALKDLVDTFSVLADQKETQAQTLLFTEDATVSSYMNGQFPP